MVRHGGLFLCHIGFDGLPHWPRAITSCTVMGQDVWHGVCSCGDAAMGRPDPQRLAMMYFPQFLIGMIATSASVAMSAYLKTGSPWAALAWAATSAVLLQIGYFALVVRLVYQPATSEGTAASQDASQSEVRLPARLIALIAIGVLSTISLKGTARADDDAYFDCVIGKAEAIMKKQTHRDAEAALERAYALCQPVESSQEADMSNELLLPDHS